jgi:small subunit ribosomal protein S14
MGRQSLAGTLFCLDLRSFRDAATVSTIEEQDEMASKSTVVRMKKVEALVKKYAAKRAELKAKGDLAGLDKLPRNSCPVRLRRLCALTGRPRGVYRKFKLARHQLRDMALDGLIPGLKKASW